MDASPDHGRPAVADAVVDELVDQLEFFFSESGRHRSCHTNQYTVRISRLQWSEPFGGAKKPGSEAATVAAASACIPAITWEAALPRLRELAEQWPNPESPEVRHLRAGRDRDARREAKHVFEVEKP